MNAPAALALAAVVSATLSGGAGAAEAPAFATDAASICIKGGASARYQYASDACWVAFDLALAKNAVSDAIAAVRAGCQTHGRSDHCLLVSWIDAPQRAIRPVRHVGRGGITASQLARLADDISTWEWDDALIGLISRQLQP